MVRKRALRWDDQVSRGALPNVVFPVTVIAKTRREGQDPELGQSAKEKISNNNNNNNNNTPVIIGAIGTISKSFRQYLSNILGKHEIKELQKTAVLDTAHVLWKVLK